MGCGLVSPNSPHSFIHSFSTHTLHHARVGGPRQTGRSMGEGSSLGFRRLLRVGGAGGWDRSMWGGQGRLVPFAEGVLGQGFTPLQGGAPKSLETLGQGGPYCLLQLQVLLSWPGDPSPQDLVSPPCSVLLRDPSHGSTHHRLCPLGFLLRLRINSGSKSAAWLLSVCPCSHPSLPWAWLWLAPLGT